MAAALHDGDVPARHELQDGEEKGGETEHDHDGDRVSECGARSLDRVGGTIQGG